MFHLFPALHSGFFELYRPEPTWRSLNLPLCFASWRILGAARLTYKADRNAGADRFSAPLFFWCRAEVNGLRDNAACWPGFECSSQSDAALTAPARILGVVGEQVCNPATGFSAPITLSALIHRTPPGKPLLLSTLCAASSSAGSVLSFL